MITIPNNRKWTQTNSGDVFGSLNSTFNVNFDKEGNIQISPKTVSIYSTSDDSDFDLPLAFVYYGGSYFILTADDPFELSSDLAIAQIVGAPADITSGSDAVAWQGRVYVTTNDDLIYWNGSSWTTGLKTTTAGVAHPLEVFENKNYIAVGDANQVHLLNTSHSAISGTPLVIPSDYEITCLKYFQSNLYIGTRTTNGTEAKIFVWNGAGATAQFAYGSGSTWVFALEEYKGSIVAVNSSGQLLQYSGGGFTPLANFPVYYTKYIWSDLSQDTFRVNKNGMKSSGDILYINIDGSVAFRNSFTYIHNQPSGVWCYDPNVGLYCRHLCTDDSLLSLSVSSLSSSTLTLSSSINATTGEPILISDVGSITGIDVRNTYYIIKVSANTVKLATTPANALDGDNITLGGSAGTATVRVVEYSNYGTRYFNTGSAGAIGIIESAVGTYSGAIFNEIVPTDIIWGYSDATTSYLNVLSSASNIGGFVLNKAWSNNMTDSFSRLGIKYNNINLDTDSIIVKSKSRDVFGLPTDLVDGTYSTASAIGTSSDLVNQAEVGFNIDIVTGSASGQSASINSFSGGEFGLDKTVYATSSDDVSFVVNNFKKKATITDGNHKVIHLEETSPWIQVMVELRGKNVAIEEIYISNKTDKNIN